MRDILAVAEFHVRRQSQGEFLCSQSEGVNWRMHTSGHRHNDVQHDPAVLLATLPASLLQCR